MKSQIIIFLATVLLSGCSKNNETQTAPIDQLPPATQTGANKVGCLVNGQVFLPYQRNPFGSPSVVCFYQFLNGNYIFSLEYSNNKIPNGFQGINIASNNITFQQGMTYQLKFDDGTSASASYGMQGLGNSSFFTTNFFTGELKITKLDQTNAIISGTFWFDAVNSAGVKVEIRDGRFDMQYSQ